jgi:hypothetical protein
MRFFGALSSFLIALREAILPIERGKRVAEATALEPGGFSEKIIL